MKIAERHVAQGERHIREQVERIERLRSAGLPVEEAEELLQLFHATLAQHARHRDLIFEELGESIKGTRLRIVDDNHD